ncbi:MAG: hypothetical protein JXB49_05475 [Bacteroidales bacterium]|nr:hypothetical protein [Bacteroidales bacterium]
MELIYTDSTEFDDKSWERMIHSLITSCDSIWINENTSFSNSIPEWVRNYYQNIFNELIEEGIIKLWNYEQNILNLTTKVKCTIETAETNNLYEAICSQINTYSNYGSIGGKNATGNELTSTIIQYKHELWNIGIANILGADGICYPYDNKAQIGGSSEYYKYELINRKYTELLFKKFEIKPVGFLSTKDIIEIRKKSKVLVKYLSEYTDNKISEIPPSTKIVENDCQAIFDSCQTELNSLIREKSLKRFGIDFSKEAAVASIGTVFPIISLIPFGEKLINLFKDKKKYSFLFFALDIKYKAYNSYKTMYNKHSDRIKYFA